MGGAVAVFRLCAAGRGVGWQISPGMLPNSRTFLGLKENEPLSTRGSPYSEG